MQIEQFRLDARPRSGWQTLDLGVQLAKQNYWSLFLWFLLPAFTVAALIGWFWHPMAGYLIAWWLKPIWERPGMLILSERIFNSHTPARTRLKSLHKIYGKQVIASLTWRRFSPSRTFDLPVVMLEGLKGKRRRARLKQLHGNFFGHSAWWLLLLANLEIALMIAAASASWLLLPQGFKPEFDLYFVFSEQYELVSNLAFLFASALIAPFFIAGGFALYIQQRIHLDCWDVQIAFSRIANRAKQRQGGTLAALFLATALLLPSTDSIATTIAKAPETIEQVLNSDEFNAERTFWYPDFGIDPFDWLDFNEPDTDLNLPSFSGAALVLEVLLWLLFVAMLIWAGYWLLKRLPHSQKRRLRDAQVNQKSADWQHFNWQALKAELEQQPRQVLRALRILSNQSLHASVPLSHCLTETELAKHGLDKAQQTWLAQLAKQIEHVAWAQQLSQRQGIEALLTHCPWEVK